jgi:serine/threonine protein kinase/predicted Zn-dependent protease
MPTTLKGIRPPTIDLEERVEAFERAFARGATAEIAEFLPPIDHPSYRDLLGELIRVEIEMLWARKAPRLVETYLARFPLLQTDPALLSAVAFEEYRQRVQSGERVTPDEYRRHFGLDMRHWPGSAAGERDEEHTNAIDLEELAGALANPGRTSSFRAGAEDVATALPDPGDLMLRRFRIIERLGKGAFGSVFLAERLDLFNRPVALKFLPGPSAEPAMLAELIHENIVPIESVDRYGPMVVICMPFRGPTTLQHVVDGLPRSGIASLSTAKLLLSTVQERSGTRSRISNSDASDSGSGIRPGIGNSGVRPAVRPLSQLEKLAGMSHVEASLRIILGVVNGLAHAHQHNIVHRDLKPANILMADDGTPMILDFNLAAHVRRDRPLDCIRLGGTFPYMAPEQIQAGRDKRECRDPRSDLYSVGVVMFELLTGQAPFPKVRRLSDDYFERLLKDRLEMRPDIRALNPAVPAGVADIVRKLLAYDPAKRYQNARHLKEDLERELSDRPLAHARETSPRARVGKFRRRYPVLTTALAALLFLILPVTLTAVLKYASYVRLRERQTAEAVVKFDDSLKTCYEVQSLARSRDKDSGLFARGVGKAEELVREYGIALTSPWDNNPEIARLDDARRRQLLDGLGETFFTLSEHSRGDRSGASERWRKLAEDCFGKIGRTPSTEKAGRGIPPASELGKQDLTKLDQAELFQLASDLIGSARYRQALLVSKELTQRDPNHFMAWFWRATCLDNLGNDYDAVHAWTTCTALKPEFAVCHFNLALAQYRCRDYTNAERSFGNAYRLDGELLNALSARAQCLLYLNQPAAAEALLTEALEKQPDNVANRLFRAQALRRMGKSEAAAADQSVGFAREPGDERGYSVRGYMRLFYEAADLVFHPARVEADLNQAIADFDRALAMNPRNRQTLYNKAIALERLDRLTEAAEVYEVIERYCPDYTPAHSTRGVLLARLGRVEEAVSEARFCESAGPLAAFPAYQLGSLYSVLSRYDARYKTEAMKLLKLSLSRGLERPDLFRGDVDLTPLRGDDEFQKLAGLAETLTVLRSQLIQP